jgi:hypothetical protein
MTGEEFEELLTRLDALIGEFETHADATVSAQSLELLRLVDAVHREGLGRLVHLIRQRQPELLGTVADDPVVRILLALYDLEPGGPPSPAAFIPLERLAKSAAVARERREGGRE